MQFKLKNKLDLSKLHSEKNYVDSLKEEEDSLVKQDNKTSKKALKKPNRNKEIINITYMFVGLMFVMVIYYSYFLFTDSKEVINNAYNKRQDLLSEQIIRGDIVSSDNKVLAYTKIDDSGNETRIYPYGSVYSHIVGRVNKGRTGIESSENFLLLTSNENGIKKIFTELSGEKNQGDRVVTTLQSKLQEVAYNALGNNKGAIVVMEPSSGKILAMVSKPDYDPNTIDAAWDDLVNDDSNNSALLNRATQGLYPPGSIFKILTTLEYMRENEGYQDYKFYCEGHGIYHSVSINCYNKKAHGHLSLLTSFAKSCNTSFASIGTTLNMSSFRKLCDSFLFNSSLPTNLVHNRSSFVLDGSSERSEIPQTVIGQGKTQVTPLHSALMISTIANGGVMMKPYVVDRIENENQTIIKKYLPELYKTVITTEEAIELSTYMQEVVKSGTASALKNKSYDAAGKTGSAEYETGKAAHAWFVGFAPARNPQIAVSIIVEGVGTGSDYAVPIAAKIFDAYFNE